MRYATWADGDDRQAGILTEDGMGLHAFSDMGLGYKSLLAYIQNHTPAHRAILEAAAKRPGTPLAAVQLLAPIPDLPGDIICVGLNYSDHVAESAKLKIGQQLPQAASYFSKRAYRPAGHNAVINAPFALDSRVDYEAEVGVVIGKTARCVAPKDVWGHVFGLCCFNDLTARDMQQKHGQWFYGKSMDGLTAFGPWIVGIEEFSLPLELEITGRVNGQQRQHSNTRHMIHSIEAIISELSAGMTLEAGTLLATGTPSGIGAGFDPPRCLAPGDVCEIEVEGVGVLRNSFE